MVEMIRASDTGYRAITKTTPTNLLRNAQSPSCAQNIGVTYLIWRLADLPNRQI